MGFKLFAAAAATAALAFATPVAAAITLTFNVQVTEATGDAAFTPFSFQETWSFEPIYSASGGPHPYLPGPYSIIERLIGPGAVTDSSLTDGLLDAAGPLSFYNEGRFVSRRFHDAGGGLTGASAGASFGSIGTNFLDGVSTRYARTLDLQSAGFYLAPNVNEGELISFLQAEGPILWAEGLTVTTFDDDGMPVTIFERSYRGTATLAVDSAAPEPGAWLLMIGGFAIAGGTLRARRRDLRQAA